MAINDAPINRQPQGLLGFVDIKSMGKNPARLGDQVAPVLELRPYYAAAARRRRAGTTAVIASPSIYDVAAGADVPLPQDKPTGFYVENVWIQSSGGAPLASGEVQFTPYARIPGGASASQRILLALGPPSPLFSTGHTPFYTAALPTPVLLPPGSTWGLLMTRYSPAVPEDYLVALTGTDVDW